MKKLRFYIIIFFIVSAGLAGYFATQLKFSFYLEQFFPKGDPDLAFFQEFIEEFENDINFLLIAVEREEGVFEEQFLKDFHELTLRARDLPHVSESQSITKVSYPLKTPFGVTAVPAIHMDDPGRYQKDKERILSDQRFVHQLISDDAKALVLALRTDESVRLEQSEELMMAVEELLSDFDFEDWHALGPAYFQKEMVAMQKREVAVSALVAGFLVSLIMFLLFQRPWGIAIALTSIGLGMLLFIGALGVSNRPLNAMAALYPVLMIIVGTSDVIHIMSKYIDELRKGVSKKQAITTTIKEIGLATLLTSLTTAIGFATLLTSRISPIREFGLNAAVGVLIAYFTVILFTTSLLSFFKEDRLIKLGRETLFWERWMGWFYFFTKNNPRKIGLRALVVLAICGVGISMITTNYQIETNLPLRKKITADFLFFEEKFAGFRPMELAVFAQGEYRADDYEVLKEMDKVENHLRSLPSVRTVNSATDIYKSINRMFRRNDEEAYRMPETEAKFLKMKKYAEKVPEANANIFFSKDGTKARISSRILDVGADSIKAVGERLDEWIAANTDENVVKFKRTGTGLILDKNSQYVRDSLLKGLALAVLIVSLLMALLFQNARMVFIAFVPNAIPLLIAGAMLGIFGIELEAGISIIFAVVFGIAVDDTIHFLSKYKLARVKGYSIDKSIYITFKETGKAICLTTVILFFGFLVMLFSIHPPSVTIGALISVTLFSALFSDLLLIPVMIRWLLKE